MRRAATLILTLLLLGAQPLPAHGYVLTLTEDGQNPIYWNGTCVFLTPSADAVSAVGQVAFLAAIQASADAWTQVGCSYFRFVIDEPVPGVRAHFDEHGQNQNVVVIREDSWPYDHAAAGLTTITYMSSGNNSVDGQVVDADVELNGVDFEFTTEVNPNAHDVQNVLTHELGHVVGLDHPCDDGMVVPTPTDHTGHPIPSCYPVAQLPPEVTQATMYNFAERGELDKRTLEPDDIAGICAIYPLADDPERCEPVPPIAPRDCACASHRGTPGDLLLCLLVLGFLLLRHRRRRRFHSRR